MLYKYLFVNTKKNPELAIKAKNKFPNFVFLKYDYEVGDHIPNGCIPHNVLNKFAIGY